MSPRRLRPVAAVLAALLVAGCGSGPPPLDVARDAAVRLAADHGVGGGLSTIDTELRGDSTAAQPLHFVAWSTWSAYVPDAIGIEIQFQQFDIGGGRNATVEGVVIHIACYPDRVVLWTTGMAALSGKETSSETSNDAGACLAHEQGNLSASLKRLVDDLRAPYWTLLAQSAFTPDVPTRNATDAYYEDGRLIGVYAVTVGGFTTVVHSVIEDGRIVEDRVENAARDITFRSHIEYHYGDRGPGPDVHGQKFVERSNRTRL